MYALYCKGTGLVAFFDDETTAFIAGVHRFERFGLVWWIEEV